MVLFVLVFTGVLITSGVLLYTYFWLLYVCHLALKVFYPLKSAKLFDSDYSRIIYITEVTIVFLIATVPLIVLAAVGSNYTVIGFPPTFCTIGSTYRIYVVVFPVLVTTSVFVTLMLLVVYQLHMVSLRDYSYSSYY